MPSPVINIKFFADLKQFSSQMKNAQRALDKYGKKLQKVGKKLTKGLTAPLVALAILSTSTFAGFEQELAKVEAISGATSVQMVTLKKNAEDLGAATRFTAKEVAGLQLNFSKLGLSPKEILNATEATLDLAQATGEDLGNSATVTASVLKAFQLNASQAGRVTDVMAKSFSSSALDLEKFKVAMSTVAPVANTANQSIEDTTGLLSVLVNSGIDASTAGTGLRNIFLDISKKGISLEKALLKISKSANKNATAMALFGKRGATVATVLADNIEEAKGLAESYRNAGGAAKAMARIMDNTLEGSLAKLKSAVEGAAISIGEQLAPSIRKVADFLATLAQRFKETSPETKRFIIIIGSFAAAIGPVIFIIGSLIRNLSAIIPVIKAVGVAIATNPIGAIATGIGLVVAALLAFNGESQKAIRAQGIFAEVTKQAADSVAGERSQVIQLLSLAKDEQLSKEQRIKAIGELNKISPEYLGNLKLETINTDAARIAVDSYNESLIRSATIKAAETKLQEIQSKIIEQELNNSRERTRQAEEQSTFANKNLSDTSAAAKIEENRLLLNEASLRFGELSIKNLKKEQELLLDIIRKNEVLLDIKKTPDPPPITSLETESKGEQRPPVVSLSPNVEGFDLDQLLSESADNIGLELLQDQLIRAREEMNLFQEEARRLQSLGNVVGSSVANAFGAMSNTIIDSLGLASNGIEGFLGTLAKGALKLIQIMLAEATALAIRGASISAAFTGPGAVFVQPAFIASAVSTVIAAFAAIPKFETGGIVGGNSRVGDKLLARVNSGEVILNDRQQTNLLNQLEGNGERVIRIVGELVGRGNDLLAVVNTAKRRKQVIGG